MALTDRNPAEIEREIDGDRRRIEEKLDAIQERLSPGQMVDELLGYVKTSGGADFVNNLGRSVKNNPMPVALMGVSLAWMMANQAMPTSSERTMTRNHDDSVDEAFYPLAPITGSLRRVGPPSIEDDSSYSHFTDDAGKRFRALTDATGRRAGHFIDESGETYRGFADAAGKQVSDIRDEADRLLDEASGWTAAAWRQTQRRMADMGSSIKSGSDAAYQSLHDQTARMGDMLTRQFRDQPLVGGALAFALGAAIGTALPHTRIEDETVGDVGDKARDTLSRKTSDAMDEGERIAAETYQKAAQVASNVQDAARDSVRDSFSSSERQNSH
ncbi:vacuolar-type H+-ATPase subunit H [Rhizobium sp. SG_E_25_P2]|uniref:DUF3618 domain-containing protein n=1 Tax=Rhizobium sp. SG_E_25_P2 TaxID=2879942 RepID=UPI002476E5C9|nr:DUF3618 domain-containing protein [Rhizobium sp. SG_E_25_P2]MDH6267701.1 vacuolar-type H+-ATPase subunit H [Rhizobium sp. SG_E_25_P2]